MVGAPHGAQGAAPRPVVAKALCADGGAIHIATFDVPGRRRRHPVLLIPGMSQDHTLWEPQIPALVDAGFRVICYDPRGTGLSDDLMAGDATYDEAPTTGTFAEHAVAVLDTMHVDKAHVIGHSMGGRVAQWLGAIHAKRVVSLVLSGTSPGETRGVPRGEEADRRLLSGDPVAMGLLNYSEVWLSKNMDVVRRIQDATTTRARQRELHYAASHGHDTWRQLERITAPALVIHGAQDQINRVENATLLADQLPHAHLHVIPKGRHGFAAEFATEWNSTVLAFLQRVD